MSPTPQDDVPGSASTASHSASSAPAPAAAPAAGHVVRTRKQIQTAEANDRAQVLAHWKQVTPKAQAKWPKLDPVELAQARGNRHRLAGLVQMRYQLSREQADQQVAEFFAVPA